MEIGGVLKSFWLMGESGRVSAGIKFSADSTRVKNMNGKTLGRTLKAHAEIPSSELWMNFAGEIIMHTRKNSTRAVKKIEKKETFSTDLLCAKFLSFFFAKKCFDFEKFCFILFDILLSFLIKYFQTKKFWACPLCALTYFKWTFYILFKNKVKKEEKICLKLMTF